jgi:transcriptional regulator with GAF, ATPase, and Fis domain
MTFHLTMPTLPDDAIRLARKFAEEAREEDEVRAAEKRAATAYPIVPSDEHGLKAPMFLHERELSDSLRIATLLASGRNPFVSEPLDRLRPEQQLEVLRALAVLACTLASTHDHVHAQPRHVAPLVDETDPALKRPLEQYMQQVEKQAVLEALAEAKNNQTEAARLLGITFRSLRYKIENLKRVL